MATSGYTVATCPSSRSGSTKPTSIARSVTPPDGTSASALAKRLIDEGLRSEAHPLVTFRDGPTGRRAALINGPDVWEVVAAVVGNDVSPNRRQAHVANLLSLSPAQANAAMDYYAELTDEIDQRIEFIQGEADRQLALREQKQRLLAK